MAIAGHQRALLRRVFDPTKQVVVGRMRLMHHGRATVGRMANNQAGAVLLGEQLLLVGVRPALQRALLDQLINHRLEQVLTHCLQVLAYRLVATIGFQQRLQQRLQRVGDGFFVQLTQLIAGLTLPLRQAGQLLVEVFFQSRNVGMKAVALLFGQLGKLGFIQRLAFFHRSKRDVLRVAIKSDALFQRQPLDRVQRAVIALVEGAVDGVFALLVGGMLKGRRKGRQQVVDQFLDGFDQLSGRPRRQADDPGLARLVEVIDVHTVLRRDLTLGLGLQIAFDVGETPSARLAHDKDVITGPAHRDAKLQRLDRSLLAKNTAEGLQVVGGGKAKIIEVDGGGELFGVKAQCGGFGGHPASLVLWREQNRIVAPAFARDKSR